MLHGLQKKGEIKMIKAVIMAGGSGSRLWPLSRADRGSIRRLPG